MAKKAKKRRPARRKRRGLLLPLALGAAALYLLSQRSGKQPPVTDAGSTVLPDAPQIPGSVSGNFYPLKSKKTTVLYL